MAQPTVFPSSVDSVLFQPGRQTETVTLGHIPSAARVTTRVQLDSSVALPQVKVVGVTVFRPTLVEIPDTGGFPGEGGPTGIDVGGSTTVEELVVVRESDGSTPVNVEVGQVVKIELVAGDLNPAFDRATGTLSVTGDTWDPISVPLQFTRLSKVETEFAAVDLTVEQGQVATTNITVRLVAGPAVDLRFHMVPDIFASDITLNEVVVSLLPGEAKTTTLAFQVARNCTVGLKILRIIQTGGLSLELVVHLDVKPATVVAPPPDLNAIRARMLRKYDRIGGARSRLGLPLHGEMPVRKAGKNFRMDFRGGQVLLDPNAAEAVAQVQLRVEVSWVGLECQIRQEGVDEVYGVIGILAPGFGGLHNEEKFPDAGGGTFDLGPSGARIVKTARRLYTGPPTDLILTLSVIEHDSGDTSAAKQKLADAIAKAAQALAGLAGLPAEATAAGDGFLNDLTLGLVNGVADLFGINDDPYPPQQLQIRAQDLLRRQFPRRTLERDDDPNTIEYTHFIVASGIDEGGDLGRYAAYFDVRFFPEDEKL
jgi:hypothetical protein